MILSILIPTLTDRNHFLNEMLQNLYKQIYESGYNGQVEIITDERNKPVTTGEKRNSLLEKAKGKYVWFVDDDDYIYDYSIKSILQACEKNPDVVGINGVMTTDGKNPIYWEIRLGHPYKAIKKEGKEYYLRHPNHITPMKREHAIKVKFPNKTVFEDYEWAKAINDAGYLKTQEIVDKQIYHYRCRSRK